MPEADREDRQPDPFGDTVAERVGRRLAGAGSVVMPAAAGFVLWSTELLPLVLLGAAVVYLLGVPASWLLMRDGGAPVRRHMVAGIAVGAFVAAAFAALDGGVLGWLIYAIFSIGIGVPLAAMAAWSALALPDRWVKPVAVAGLLVTVGVLPVATWFEQRPPAPYDFVVIGEPAAVESDAGDAYLLARDITERVGDAHALAEAIAERFEQRAAEGHPPTAHATWVAIGQDLSDELEGIPTRMRFTTDDELPTMQGTDDAVRLLTTIIEGRAMRGCVIVTATTSTAEPRACAELNLVN